MSLSSKYFDAVKNIGGWFYEEDAFVLEAIHKIQTSHHIGGDILEIGAYQGKSAAFLGFLLQPAERLVVCDLFEQHGVNAENRAEKAVWYSSLNRREFERHYLEVHAHLPRILACRSSAVKRVGNLGATFRLIHIDGSHLYHIVKQDLLTASELLKKGGIIAIDDYRTEHTPGVAAAAWEAALSSKLIPLCLTPQKMYATCKDTDVAWLGKLKRWGQTQDEFQVATEKVYGKHLLRLSRNAVKP
ncbi:MAG TPA: class I SAM-dependent methyltransferase [Nitrospiraceae bacterium]|nr:class I SAM-dependent methyltransferase [Nitrospiraceae bacterium]